MIGEVGDRKNRGDRVTKFIGVTIRVSRKYICILYNVHCTCLSKDCNQDITFLLSFQHCHWDFEDKAGDNGCQSRAVDVSQESVTKHAIKFSTLCHISGDSTTNFHLETFLLTRWTSQ